MIRFIVNNIYCRIKRYLKPLFFLLCVLFRFKKWSDFFCVLEECRNRQIPSINKTIYFNFRFLPYQQAVITPIFVYPYTQFQDLTGKLKINGEISTGMIKIGRDWGYRCKGKTRIRIAGELLFSGKCEILRGSDICIFKTGKVSFGDNVLIGENVLIYCMESISLGNTSRITYETNIYDSDFHYTIDIDKKEIKRMTSPIVIGNYVWIGNRTNIKKGVRIPDYTIVAGSGSLLTKDYTNILTKFGCLAGYPARPLPMRSCRTWKNELERIKYLDNWFAKHPDKSTFEITDDENLEDYIGITIDTNAGQ